MTVAQRPAVLTGEEPRREVEAVLKRHQSRVANEESSRADGDRDDDAYPTPDPLVYRGLVGNFVRAVEHKTEADPVAVLVQTLVAAGNCVGRTAHFVVDTDVHYLNLFAVVVGRTGRGRKGVSWSIARKLMSMVDPAWAETRIKRGLSSGEGLIWEVRDPVEKEGEGGAAVVVDAGVADKRLLAEETEFASVLKVLKRDSNTLSPVLRMAWDSQTLSTLVKHSPARATGAHLSCVAHITSEELLRSLAASEWDNGLANRILWVCARRTRLLPFGDSLQTFDWGCHAGNFVEAVRRARDTAETRLAEDAKPLWEKFYRSLESHYGGHFAQVTARAAPLTRRLACLYALFDCDERGAHRPCRGEVARNHLESAIALWRYCEASAAYIFGRGAGDPDADRILQSLRDAGEEGMTRTELRDLFGRNKRADEIGYALRLLAECGLAVRKTDAPRAKGGKPVERWHAVDQVGAPRDDRTTEPVDIPSAGGSVVSREGGGQTDVTHPEVQTETSAPAADDEADDPPLWVY